MDAWPTHPAGFPPRGMRTRRIKAPSDAESGLYHCISRVVDRRLVFGATEKERFCDLMRRYAFFCGVRVLTFCVMSNHFHLLVEVPRRPDQPPSDHELLERIAAIHSSGRARVIRELFARATPEERETLRHRFWRRMGDLSQFLKELKQRFSQWHNLRQGRRGTLWEERFRSVLIGPDGRALTTVAAYIDLNPVRAGMVEQAQDYPWSSHRHCIGQASDKLVTLHALYWSLGNTPFAREAAYAELVKTGLATSQRDELTRTALSGWALGSEDFLGELQQGTKRRLLPGKAGRPLKKWPD